MSLSDVKHNAVYKMRVHRRSELEKTHHLLCIAPNLVVKTLVNSNQIQNAPSALMATVGLNKCTLNEHQQLNIGHII